MKRSAGSQKFLVSMTKLIKGAKVTAGFCKHKAKMCILADESSLHVCYTCSVHTFTGRACVMCWGDVPQSSSGWYIKATGSHQNASVSSCRSMTDRNIVIQQHVA